LGISATGVSIAQAINKTEINKTQKACHFNQEVPMTIQKIAIAKPMKSDIMILLIFDTIS
jgi:hypothetical protein